MTSSVPLFKFFDRRTRCFFRREKRDSDQCHHDKYDIGRKFVVKASCCDGCDIKVKFKRSEGNAGPETKFILDLKRDFGSVKLVETGTEEGLKVAVNVPKFYKNFDLRSKHSNAKVDVEFQYNPGTFYNGSIQGTYEPEVDGERVCKTIASFACGDAGLKLNVGAEITVASRLSLNDNAQQQSYGGAQIENYRVGFLYEPTECSSYSVLYTPDRESNGLDFAFTCFKQLSEKVDVAARAQGKVDIQRSGNNPILSVAAGYKVGENNFFRGFFSSNREYGLSYRAQLSALTNITFGIANYLDDNKQLNSRFGYRLVV